MGKKGRKVASKQAAMKARKKNRGSAVRLTEAQTSVTFSKDKETKPKVTTAQDTVSSDQPELAPKRVAVQPKADVAVQDTVFTYLRVELLHIACIAIVLAAALAVLTITLN